MAKNTPHLSEIISPKRWLGYMGNPADFIEDLILHKRAVKYGGKLFVTDQQLEVLNAIVRYRQIAVKAGRGVGKTALLSWLIIWWQCMFAKARVVCTAPSFPQLQSVLWPEVSKWLSDSLLSDYFVHTARRMYLVEDAKNNFSEPRTASKEESAQGLHELHMLILMDEASGIPDAIFEVIQGSMTNDNNIIVTMTNPTRISGFSYDSFHSDKEAWKRITLSSEDSPIVDPKFLKIMRDKYTSNGYVHDMYKMHVLGEYPSGDPDAYLSIAEVEKAMHRGILVDKDGLIVPIKGIKDGVVEVAIDVARKGNDLTVCGARVGKWVFSAQELGLAPYDPSDLSKEELYSRGKTTIPESVQMVYDVVDAVRKLTKYDGVIRVKVDDTGVGGGVTDLLELDKIHNIEVIPVNFGGAGDEYYANEASIMWGRVKEIIGEIHLPNCRFMMEELSTRRWYPDSKGRIKMETKKEFKKEFGASPDNADMIVMLFSDKENERRFIKFNPASDESRGYAAGDLKRVGDRFCAMYCSPTQKVSVIWASWNSGKLKIYDEYEGDSLAIIDYVKVGGKEREYKKLIGSEKMFKPGTDDLSMQYMNRGLYVMPQFGYDEAGAINHLSRLSEGNNLLIAKECKETFGQLRTWTSNRSKGKMKEDYGLCYAMSLIVSELVSTNRIIKTILPKITYDANVDYHIDINDGFFAM